MNTMILRVKKCGVMTTVQCERQRVGGGTPGMKSENGVLNKRTLVLQELGGKYANSYVVTTLGNLATIDFAENELVVADLRFQTREYNGQAFMDVVANEICKIKR